MRRALPILLLLTVAAGAAPAAAGGDPLRAEQYGLTLIRAEEAWNASRADGVLIAVVDTGVDADHEDLAGRVIPGRDFVDLDEDPADGDGHGTAVAGIAAAAVDNGEGISGVAPGARILSIRIVDESGGWNDGRLASAIRYAVERASRQRMSLVVNLSLADLPGLQTSSAGRATEGAIGEAYRSGAVVIVAAGLVAPQLRQNVANMSVWVGSSDQQDRRVLSTGSAPDVLAPGEEIITTRYDPSSPTVHDTYTCADERCTRGSASGTSYAAAHASGVAALMLGRKIDNRSVLANLVETADRVQGGSTCNGERQCGRINAATAVSGTPASPQPSAGPLLPLPKTLPSSSPVPETASPVAPRREEPRTVAKQDDVEKDSQPAVLQPIPTPVPIKGAPPATGVSPDRAPQPEKRFPIFPAAALVAVVASLAALAWMHHRPAPASYHRSYVPVLEGVRGIAVLSVVAFHVLVLAYAGGNGLSPALWVVAAGNLGVDLFFVLSGFLLFQGWESLRARMHTREALLDYARRRALRILPLFWFSLLLLVPLRAPHLIGAGHLRELGLFATVQQYLSPDLPWQVNGVTWSLTTEFQFYVLLPIVALTLRKFGVWRVVAALVAVSVIWRMSVYGSWIPADWIPGRIDQFAAGMAAAALVAAPQSRATRGLRSPGVATTIGVVTIAVVFAYGSLYGRFGTGRSRLAELLVHPVLGVLTAALLVRLTAVRRRTLFDVAPMRFLGLISYSLYLWHVPILEVGGWHSRELRSVVVLLLLLTAAVAVSALSFVYVERPAMSWRMRARTPATSAVAGRDAVSSSQPAMAETDLA